MKVTTLSMLSPGSPAQEKRKPSLVCLCENGTWELNYMCKSHDVNPPHTPEADAHKSAQTGGVVNKGTLAQMM
jgi:hypothetical protein